MTPAIAWLLAGIVCVALEMFALPGIGFLFAGIGALVTGGLVEATVLNADATVHQFIIFFAVSALSAALLWKHLKRRPSGAPKYHNMVGDEAIVGAGGLMGGQVGQVKWSGTIMRAQLAEGANVDVLPEATVVIIRKVEGNTLFVTPKFPS